MANTFKMAATSLSTTGNTDLLTGSGSSVLLISSIIIANRTVGTDTTVDLTFYDDSSSSTFYILRQEPITARYSKEILARPMVMEAGDILKIQAANASVVDVLISYLDRNRD